MYQTIISNINKKYAFFSENVSLSIIILFVGGLIKIIFDYKFYLGT